MTTGAHDSGGGFGRSAGANVARGVMVIVGAVIIGLLLMNRGLGDTQAEATAADATTETTASTEATTATETTAEVTETTAAPTTLGAPRDPSEVAVLVINGTDSLKGVAGRGTDILKTSNYITREPKNADVNGPSVILYLDGYQAEANAIAVAYGVDPAAVVQAFDPASSPIADTQEANVIVRIGNDGVIQV